MSVVYLRVPTQYPEQESKAMPKRRRKHKCSKGEIFISKVLTALGFAYQKEYSIPTLPKLRFDFLVGTKILIEYDSDLHMKFCKYIHKTEKKFLKAQQRDAIKNQEATESGYLIVRIDESLLNQGVVVSEFLKTQIDLWDGTGKFVTPNPHLYQYLQNQINPKIFSKYKKICT